MTDIERPPPRATGSGRSHPMRPHPSTAQPQAQDIVVYDGRDAVGFVRKIGNIFVAYDAGRQLIGRFTEQCAALRAIPTFRKTASTRDAAAGQGTIHSTLRQK